MYPPLRTELGIIALHLPDINVTNTHESTLVTMPPVRIICEAPDTGEDWLQAVRLSSNSPSHPSQQGDWGLRSNISNEGDLLLRVLRSFRYIPDANPTSNLRLITPSKAGALIPKLSALVHISYSATAIGLSGDLEFHD